MSASMFIIGMAVLSLLVIIYPLLIKQNKHQQIDSSYDDEWSQEKERVFLQLSDLEYDYRMGKIFLQDYEKTKAELTAVAARYTHRQETGREHVSQLVDQEIDRYLSERGVRNES